MFRQKEPSQILADYMLRGWALLGEHCPESDSIPLLKNRQGRKICVGCQPRCKSYPMDEDTVSMGNVVAAIGNPRPGGNSASVSAVQTPDTATAVKDSLYGDTYGTRGAKEALLPSEAMQSSKGGSGAMQSASSSAASVGASPSVGGQELGGTDNEVRQKEARDYSEIRRKEAQDYWNNKSAQETLSNLVTRDEIRNINVSSNNILVAGDIRAEIEEDYMARERERQNANPQQGGRTQSIRAKQNHLSTASNSNNHLSSVSNQIPSGVVDVKVDIKVLETKRQQLLAKIEMSSDMRELDVALDLYDKIDKIISRKRTEIKE